MDSAAGGMKIVELYTSLTTVGGAERQFLEEVRALRARGHEVVPVTFAASPNVLALADAGEPPTVLNGRTWFGKVRALRAFLRKTRPDLVVAHTSPELTWLTTIGTGVPFVLYQNSPPFLFLPNSNPYGGLWRWHPAVRSGRVRFLPATEFPQLDRMGPVAAVVREVRAIARHFALRRATNIVVVSERGRGELRDLHGVESAVVQGCLSADLVADARSAVERGDADADGILSVSRLDPIKRIDLLIRAFAIVHARRPAARLVIGGEGPEAERLSALARELGVADGVRFLGRVSEDERVAWYRRSAVFATPMVADYAIAPYEALAHGCRVVWTPEMDVEASPELRDSGWVASAAADPEAFAEGILTALAASPPAPPALANLTWEARGARVEAIYRAAIAPRTVLASRTRDRILLLQTGAPGGVGRFEYDLRHALDRSIAMGTRISSITRRGYPAYLRGSDRATHEPAARRLTGFAAAAAWAALRQQPRVIIYTHINLARIHPFLRLLAPRARSVVMFHGQDAWARQGFLQRQALRRITVVLTSSAFNVRELRRYHAADIARLEIIPLGMHAGWAAEPNPARRRPDPVVLAVARLEVADRAKGIDRVIRAMPLVRRQVPDARLVVVGDGADRPRLQEVAREEGVTATVRFTGHIDDAALRSLYASASVFAMPSLKEGFGFVYLEAMAFGIPAIGARETAVAEVIHDGETGLLVDPADPADLSGAIALVLTDPSLRERLGAAAARSVQTEFSAERFAREVWALIESLAREAR